DGGRGRIAAERLQPGRAGSGLRAVRTPWPMPDRRGACLGRAPATGKAIARREGGEHANRRAGEGAPSRARAATRIAMRRLCARRTGPASEARVVARGRGRLLPGFITIAAIPDADRPRRGVTASWGLHRARSPPCR
ncbi:MAG: hypothetical protein ACK56I_16365, partial [bacterium]